MVEALISLPGEVEHCNPAQLLIFLIMTLSYPDMVKLYVER